MLFFRWSIGRSSAFKTFEELEEVAMDYVRAIQIVQTIGNRTDKDYSLKFKTQIEQPNDYEEDLKPL